MKPKIGVYLTRDVAKRLKVAVRQSGATKSDIVNEALSWLLDPPPENDPREDVLRRLDRMTKRIRRIHRDVEIVAETLALHIRQFLMITPPRRGYPSCGNAVHRHHTGSGDAVPAFRQPRADARAHAGSAGDPPSQCGTAASAW